MSITLKPAPKSVGKIFETAERYTGDFNGKIKITKVDKIENGDKKGSIIVHMANARLEKDGMEITDGFFLPKTGTSSSKWAQTQVDRVAGAMLSAGVEPPENITVEKTTELLTELKKCLDQLVGKEVLISQYTKDNENYPRINYKFVSDEVAIDEDEIIQ